MSAFASHAQAWLSAGWGAFPLPAGKKFPPPQGWTGRGAPYPSGADVQAWIEEHADANLGLRFPPGVIGLDVDQYDDKHGLATLVACSKQWGKLPPTVRITSRPDTRSGIYLYRLPEGASSDRFLGELPGGNVEILRPEHRYAVGPGSIHPSGATYVLTTDGGGPIHPEQLPELPMAWVEGLTVPEKADAAPVDLVGGRGNAYARAAVEAVVRELREIADWPDGKTDAKGRGWEKIQADAAFRLASLALADWNDLTLQQAMDAFGDAAPVGGAWTALDVASKWRSQVRRAEPADPPKTSDDPLAAGFQFIENPTPTVPGAHEQVSGKPGLDPQDSTPSALPLQVSAEWVKHSWDDRGNAERIVALLGSRLKYLPAVDRWMIYDETHGRWEESKLGGYSAAQQMIEALPRLETHLYSDREYEKSKGKTTTERKEFLEWVSSQRFDGKYRAAASVLKATGLVDDSPGSFDADPMLLNCRNGVIDLRTGELRAHDPVLRLRRQIPVSYDPDAKAKRWVEYIERAHPDEELRSYLQRIVGYSLTGSTKEQVFFIHHGPPRTGKSVFLDVLTAILGDFSRVVPPSVLMRKKNEGHPTEIMGLAGRRLLTMSETAEGGSLDAALVKRLSGSDPITARGMGEDFQDFRLVGKIHLVTNHLPHIPDDAALQRRIHIAKWDVVIPPDEIDYDLEEDILREELPGVLAWCVQGALEWYRRRLDRPAAAHLAALDYFEEEDEFGDFLSDTLAPSEVAWTSNKQLYQLYLRWCDSTRVRPMSRVQFGRKLAKRGFRSIRTNTDRGFYCTLKTDPIRHDPLA